jgi:hypothetical protein
VHILYKHLPKEYEAFVHFIPKFKIWLIAQSFANHNIFLNWLDTDALHLVEFDLDIFKGLRFKEMNYSGITNMNASNSGKTKIVNEVTYFVDLLNSEKHENTYGICE